MLREEDRRVGARVRALDPTVSDVVAARQAMDNACFRRERLREAVKRLDARRGRWRRTADARAAYDAAKAEREMLAEALAGATQASSNLPTSLPGSLDVTAKSSGSTGCTRRGPSAARLSNSA